MVQPPAEVHVRPLPGAGYEDGFRMICTECDGHLWIERGGQHRPGFEALPCPECQNDIGLALNVALSDARLRHLRAGPLLVKASP